MAQSVAFRLWHCFFGVLLANFGAHYLKASQPTPTLTPPVKVRVYNFDELMAGSSEKIDEALYELLGVKIPFVDFKRDRIKILEADLRKKLPPINLARQGLAQQQATLTQALFCRGLWCEWTLLGGAGIFLAKYAHDEKSLALSAKKAVLFTIAAAALARMVSSVAVRQFNDEQKRLTECMMQHTSDATIQATASLQFRLDLLSCLALRNDIRDEDTRRLIQEMHKLMIMNTVVTAQTRITEGQERVATQTPAVRKPASQTQKSIWNFLW